MIEALFNPVPISDPVVWRILIERRFVETPPPDTYQLEVAHPTVGTLKLNFSLQGYDDENARYWFESMEDGNGENIS